MLAETVTLSKDEKIIEKTNVAAAHPEIVAKLTALAERKNAEIGGSHPSARRPAGHVANSQTVYPTEPRKHRKK